MMHSFLPLAGLAGLNAPVEFVRAPTRHAQRLPPVGLKMFGEKDDLTAMIRVMRNLAVDGLHDRVGFAADGDGSDEIGIGKRLQRLENAVPALFPQCEQSSAGLRRIEKFGV